MPDCVAPIATRGFSGTTDGECVRPATVRCGSADAPARGAGGPPVTPHYSRVNCSRSTLFCTFPIELRGSSSEKNTRFGTL